MQKTKTIALALILFLGICTTPALAITASDEEIITKAVSAALQAVEDTRATSNLETTSDSDNSVSMEDVLKNLDPREQITIESLQRIEQILKNQKANEASNLQASILNTADSSNTTSNSEAIASAMETIRGLQQSKYSKDASTTSNNTIEEKTTEDKIEITPISPDLLRSSAEPLMQFSRSLTRKAVSPLDVASTVKTNILAADEETTSERVVAEGYHRTADEESTSVFSTQNLIILGISLAFLIAGIVLFFIRFEKKLLSTNGKFEHLSFFQKDHNKTIL